MAFHLHICVCVSFGIPIEFRKPARSHAKGLSRESRLIQWHQSKEGVIEQEELNGVGMGR